jgi:hypothetical protein
VVIDKVFAAVDMCKQCYVPLHLCGRVLDVQEVCWNDIEVTCVPIDLFVELLYTEAIVS